MGTETVGISGLSLLAVIGVIVWLAGMFFEAVGDLQLARFKADVANRGRVMNHGPWRYTRHPNYFGDFLVRWGLYLVAAEAESWWWTIVGGSKRYVKALLEPIQDRIRLGCPVQSVTRHVDDVVVTPENGPGEFFDEVVFASHADQTLRMLRDPTRAEEEILRGFPYQSNEAVLHTDTSLLRSVRRAWASWNCHLGHGDHQPACVTYELSRLQRHDSPRPILLTLNA